jgi:nitrite reductase [NAD(P)H] small subunit
VIDACRVDDVPPGEGRALEVGGRRLAVFHTAAGWFALDQRCPHLGGPLADGLLADRTVTCPLHERRFDLATGAALGDGCDVAAYRAEVRDDRVYVDAREPPPRPQPPARWTGSADRGRSVGCASRLSRRRSPE